MADYVPEELLPPEGHPGVGEAVADIISKVFTYREDEKIPDRCNRFYKMRRAKHWKYETSEVPLLSANLIGTHHKKTVNMLTANNPTFDIVPAGELGDDADEKLSLQKSTADNWWNDTEQQMVYRESADSGELYGTVGEYAYMDVEENFPYGEIMVETMDLLYMSMYPPECREMRKAEAFLRWYPMTVREARRKWPKSADKIVGDMSMLEDIGDERQEDHKAEQKLSLTRTLWNGALKFLSGKKNQTEVSDTDKLFIIEIWVKDYSKREDGEPVYPGNIRRVIICNAGNTVLEDRYNPSLNQDLPVEVLQENYLYSRFPFSYVQPVPDPSSPFGLSDFEQLERLNMELNKALSQFTMFKDKASRLKLINPKDSGVTDQELNNVDGILRPTNHLVAQGIGFVPPPQMGTDIPTALGLYKDLFNEIAGSFSDVTQGQKQGSEVVAAKAIALLLETEARQAQGKGQSYAKMLRERGRMYLALAQMWYDTPRYIQTRKNGKKVTVPVTSKSLQAPTKLNVVSGSTMPVSDIHRRDETLGLFQMGLVDQEQVLKTLEVDNYQDIIARMQKGPMGQFLQKLGMTGVPKELLGLFEQVGQMDEEDIEKALKEGKIPPFQQILMKMVQAQAGQPQPPNPEMIELGIKQKESEAKIRKMDAETELAREKKNSEQIEQMVRAEGVKLDWENLRENLKINKAQAIASIQNQKRQGRESQVRLASDIAKTATDDERAARAEMRQDQGGYDERGMVSNNWEQ